jgi:hypothetical protein
MSHQYLCGQLRDQITKDSQAFRNSVCPLNMVHDALLLAARRKHESSVSMKNYSTKGRIGNISCLFDSRSVRVLAVWHY